MPGGTAKLDLALYLEDRQGGISGMLEYNRDLFDSTTAVRLLAAFERIVEEVVQSQEQRLDLFAVECSLRVAAQAAEISPAGSLAPKMAGSPFASV